MPVAAIAHPGVGTTYRNPEAPIERRVQDLLIRAGRVSEVRLDDAVARVLRLKFEAGLFESPYLDVRRAIRETNTAADIGLARKAAQKSIVLLKNDGVLPLDPAARFKLGVIGPNAVEPLFGGYSGVNDKAVGILAGVKAAAGPNLTVEQADGVRIITPTSGRHRGVITLVAPEENAHRIAHAVEVASRSDVVLLINGRALTVNRLAEKANALLEGWYLGQEGGNAFADVLFGKVNPGGKLPVSFPRAVGELPVYYDRHPSATINRYVEDTGGPLFPFGHGLSYTTFQISAPRLAKPQIAVGETAVVEVEVPNVGKRAGDEVVQLYIRDDVSSVPRPILELRGFQRVSLKPGEIRTLRFELNPDALAFWDIEMRWTVEPGTFTISVGPSSAVLKSSTLTVV